MDHLLSRVGFTPHPQPKLSVYKNEISKEILNGFPAIPWQLAMH